MRKANIGNISKNAVRIIAGSLRGRKVYFTPYPLLKPTPDRVRETLFNWLSPVICNATCLDLFAGSGIFGFEAISRGAASVTAIENNPVICQQIKNNINLLKVSLTLIISDVISWLNKKGDAFDIVFLDPPYKDNPFFKCFELLNINGWIKSNSKIYFEHNAIINDALLPSNWHITKSKKAGQVHYYLAEVQ